MSQALMENAFPLAGNVNASYMRGVVKDSLYDENADPWVEDGSNEALLYVRSDWQAIRRALEERGIVLTPQEDADLFDFASQYASLVDEERDMAELEAMRRKEGEES